MNEVAVNIHVYVFMQTYAFISLGYILSSNMADSYGISFKETAKLFSKVVVSFAIPASNV